MKVVINPQYANLHDFIMQIPSQDYVCDTVIRDYRNVLQKVTVNGTTMVIKRYKRPTLANCFIYTFFRRNKARRSYEYAFRLQEMGIDTAEPIAYIEITKYGFFHTGYFISEFMPHALLSSIESHDAGTQIEIIRDFATFTANLHEKGIIHYDYNTTNIFFHKEKGQNTYRFALIDINRMRFKKLSRKECIKGLEELSFKLPLLSYMIECYSKLRGWNVRLFYGSLLIRQSIHISDNVKQSLKSVLQRITGLFNKKEIKLSQE